MRIRGKKNKQTKSNGNKRQNKVKCKQETTKEIEKLKKKFLQIRKEKKI